MVKQMDKGRVFAGSQRDQPKKIEYPQTEVQEAVLYRATRETRAFDYIANVDD